MKVRDVQLIIYILQKEEIKSVELLDNDGKARGQFIRIHYGDTFEDGIDQITDFDPQGNVIE